jgi:GntR family transcriptional regulator
MSTLNAKDSVPLYRQLMEIIRSRIKEGTYAEGDRIPSEAKLCEEFGVSRITVRQALGELVQSGFLYRAQGKGTFVAKRRFVQKLLRLSSMSESLIDGGFVPGSQTIAIQQEEPQARIRQHLGLQEGETCLLVIRLRLSDDIPLVLNYSYFPPKLLDGLVEVIAQGPSIYRALEEQLGIKVDKVQQTIELTSATEFEAKHLEIQPHAPVYLVRAITLDSDGHVVEYVKSIYRTDRTEFFVELKRN